MAGGQRRRGSSSSLCSNRTKTEATCPPIAPSTQSQAVKLIFEGDVRGFRPHRVRTSSATLNLTVPISILGTQGWSPARLTLHDGSDLTRRWTPSRLLHEAGYRASSRSPCRNNEARAGLPNELLHLKPRQ